MSIPGVSGGTTALALGCYGNILSATANLRKKEHIIYLLPILIGGVLGFFTMAKVLSYAFHLLPITITLLFLGAVVMGIRILWNETSQSGFSLNGALFFLLGFISIWAIEKIPNLSQYNTPFLSLLWGILLAVGVILPGISTSHLLMIFGLYETVTNLCIQNIPTLIPLAIGTGIGIIFLTKPLDAALKKYPTNCNFMLLGFAVGSLKDLILPCLSSPQMTYLPVFQTINGIILGTGAAWGILMLNRVEKKVKKL